MDRCEITSVRDRDVPSALLDRDLHEYGFTIDGWCPARKDPKPEPNPEPNSNPDRNSKANPNPDPDPNPNPDQVPQGPSP